MLSGFPGKSKGASFLLWQSCKKNDAGEMDQEPATADELGASRTDNQTDEPADNLEAPYILFSKK